MRTLRTTLFQTCWLISLLGGLALLTQCGGESPPDQEETLTVRAVVQARPGGPVEEIEMKVHEVPVDPASESAGEAPLEDSDLVLGVVVDGQPMAYPIRFLARHEVVNDRVGETALAPTW